MHDERSMTDAEFERWLLDSAREERLPSELTSAAWTRFAEAGGRMTSAAGAAWGPGHFGARLSRAGLKWLAAGALAGGLSGAAVTFVVLSNRAPAIVQAPSRAPLDQVREAGSAAEPDLRQATPATSPAAPAAAPESTRSKEESSSPAAQASRRLERAASTPSQRRAPNSTLAAEVQALDEIRNAAAAGRYSEALAGVTAFHENFPRAQLGADAEGLAIEALLGQGDGEGAARRAKRFLQSYPEDPLAARFAPIARQKP